MSTSTTTEIGRSMTAKKSTMERLSIQAESELKRALRKQAKRARLSLSEWVRTRLWLEWTDPAEMETLLKEMVKLSRRIERSNAESDACRAEWEAREREVPLALAEAQYQGSLLAERLVARTKPISP